MMGSWLIAKQMSCLKEGMVASEEDAAKRYVGGK